MYSLFDSYVIVDENNSAVTLVYKGYHAALVLESTRLDDPKTREIRYAHFIPIEMENAQGSLENMTNTVKEFLSSPRPARVDVRIIEAEDAVSLASRLRITHITTTYSVNDRNKMNTLINTVRDEQQNRAPVPQFQIRGVYCNDGEAFNCRSWVREKLKIVGYTIEPGFIDKVSSDTLNSGNSSSVYTSENTDSSVKCLIL